MLGHWCAIQCVGCYADGRVGLPGRSSAAESWVVCAAAQLDTAGHERSIGVTTAFENSRIVVHGPLGGPWETGAGHVGVAAAGGAAALDGLPGGPVTVSDGV